MTATTTDRTDAANEHALSVEVDAALVRGTATEVDVTSRQHRFTVDEPASLGGTDKGANPVEHLLAALGSCTVISYQVWAQKLGLTLDGVDVKLRGDLDTRGFFGLDDTVRPGFEEVQVEIALSGPEEPARYLELAEQVEQHCPVLDGLKNGVPVRTTVNV